MTESFQQSPHLEVFTQSQHKEARGPWESVFLKIVWIDETDSVYFNGSVATPAWQSDTQAYFAYMFLNNPFSELHIVMDSVVHPDVAVNEFDQIVPPGRQLAESIHVLGQPRTFDLEDEWLQIITLLGGRRVNGLRFRYDASESYTYPPPNRLPAILSHIGQLRQRMISFFEIDPARAEEVKPIDAENPEYDERFLRVFVTLPPP